MTRLGQAGAALHHMDPAIGPVCFDPRHLSP
jgi:hypothetical protein